MRINNKNGVKRVTIDPGEYHASREPVIISTLLGSCVSACLYDPVTRVVGMNHFLLANKRYARNIPVIESEAGRYGIHAMELLINEMLKLGAKRAHFKAKVFGGGDVLRYYKGGQDNFFYVGEINCRFVREFLRYEKIPVTASDLGRDYGRIVHFRSTDYSAYMKIISHSQDVQVVNSEHKYWQQNVDKHEHEKDEIQIW
ncbi:MAG: chemotaxis protein CheD [Gammaproteobacteria bacterium]|nr:chemotaxis protein CheD [Gammaproteobacteria bacterium]MCP4278018.1 chemotaxis protein CheD [Gammaproteobacteria bacterium]